MAFVVGLTGGIASGKTTVANLFHDHFQIEIVDADIIAREVVEPGSEGLRQILSRYGDELLTHDGVLNRPRLREIIFAQPEEKQWLDALLHPLIRLRMTQQLKQVTSPYALLVIPLMVENNLQTLADHILVVDVDESTQIERTMNRDGVSENQAKSILKSQASREARLAIANDVITNHTKNQQLLYQITKLHKKYLEMCSTNR
ncbi:dephospho-CoA kinase [Vibrio renipiscarius]|uniref:Dephospho-CoA kinase n=1 Tax=Vibrio renipiscarius TaxID=1461322 RepID=A0A0C2NRT3_9VIBR|nr:dephospho-CoA kinase [Vibrio renipiscarius]KII78548.1 dephospho-CoA kinase [Vibrio renipiscarius]KII82186.1 dephospho-CoA kinase [Vibrio renipiscarius]